MEMVLEQEEVVALVVEGLRRRGIDMPDPETLKARFRPNNKKQTYRLALTGLVTKKEKEEDETNEGSVAHQHDRRDCDSSGGLQPGSTRSSSRSRAVSVWKRVLSRVQGRKAVR